MLGCGEVTGDVGKVKDEMRGSVGESVLRPTP